MAKDNIKMRMPVTGPVITKVPFSDLQEKGGMFFEPKVTNPKGKANPVQKQRDFKNGKK